MRLKKHRGNKPYRLTQKVLKEIRYTDDPHIGKRPDNLPPINRNTEPYINHHPWYPGIWHEFNGYTYKTLYVIRLHNGDVYGGPNLMLNTFTTVYPNCDNFLVSTRSVKDGKISAEAGTHLSIPKDCVSHVKLLSMEECYGDGLCLQNDSFEELYESYGDLLPEIGIGDLGDLLYLQRRREN